MELIIKTRTSRAFKLVDTTISCFAWLAFAYLMGSGAVYYFSHGFVIKEHFYLLSDTLFIYFLVALANGLLLVAWASYNAWRYRSNRRRRTATPLLREDMARTFGAFAYQMAAVEPDRVVIIRHDDGGLIEAVETPGTQSPVRAMPMMASVSTLRERIA